MLHTILLLVPLAVGGALMAAGSVMLGLKQISSVWLLGSGLLVLALVAALTPLWNTYRRAPASTVGSTVFHLTAADWAVGDVVTLKARRVVSSSLIGRGAGGCLSSMCSRSVQRSITRRARPCTVAVA